MEGKVVLVFEGARVRYCVVLEEARANWVMYCIVSLLEAIRVGMQAQA
jgi:hypothetical protein